ncbi:MAG TPA: hypothetical protein PLU55_01740 [Candidatus Pacearchaeota archaeon]|nr:hypothetical protein [Candidatus Pacearchaeota archaeon]
MGLRTIFFKEKPSKNYVQTGEKTTASVDNIIKVYNLEIGVS